VGFLEKRLNQIFILAATPLKKKIRLAGKRNGNLNLEFLVFCASKFNCKEQEYLISKVLFRNRTAISKHSTCDT
jgi:hypothetical protein